MRLLDLHIKRYGHFSDRHVPLDGDGLHLLVGPNEAGKTTLLQFVRDVLFTFGGTNPYDFCEGRIEGRASMRLSSGQIVVLQRHKGLKRTVDVRIDGQETSHDEHSFLTLLGGATKNLFRSVFAFGLKELAEADNSLDESVRTALYGGGLASVGNPQRILDALAREAEKLFKKGGKNQQINMLCTELQSLSKEVKAKSVRCADYHAAQAQLDEAEQEAQQGAAEHRELSRKCSHTKRLLKAFPVWCELSALETERRGLSAPDGFPADASQMFMVVAAAIKGHNAERQRLLHEIDEYQRQVDQVTLIPRLLDQRHHIEHALGMRQSAAEARRDLPVVRLDLENSRQGVQHELSRLVADWRLEQLSGFTFGADREAALDAMAAERKSLDDQKTTLVTRQGDIQDQLETAADELADAPAAEDVSMLLDVLGQQETYNNQMRDLARLQKLRRANANAIDALALALNPPLAIAADAHKLPVPPKETIAEFKRLNLEHAARVDAAEKLLDAERGRLDALEKELAALDGRSELLPTRDGLALMRARRDAGWQLVHKKYVAGEDAIAEIENWLSTSNLSLPDAYEEAVREADHYSDEILTRSSAVAKQEQVQAALGGLEEKRQTLAELKTAGVRLDWKWREQWAACGFVPLGADAMETWLGNHAQLRKLVAETADQDDAIRGLAEQTAHFDFTVRKALGDKDQSCAALLAMAKSRVQQAEAIERERQSLLKSQRGLQIAAKRCAEELEEHARREREWQARWTGFLARLGLPEQWSVALAQKVIAGLNTAREKLGKVPDLEARIVHMEGRLKEIGASYTNICKATMQDDVDELPEVGIARLNAMLTAAVKDHERHDSLQKTLDEKSGRLRDVEAELGEARASRARLMSLAGVNTDDDFRQVAECACRIAELDVAITRQRRELDKDRENEDASEFSRLLAEADLDVLREQERDSAWRLEEAEQKRKGADERVWSCRQIMLNFEKGDSQAAQLQEQLAGKRARLAAEVDRYVPLLFAQQLLEQAIKKFEQESQPAMLQDVSKIFASMTGDRYVRVQRSNENDDALVVRRADDRLLEPSELSTGTREQLYLAIRLAYVLHYCGRAEPLPIVMDDVLANFDDDRALRTLETLGEVSRQVQVLMFTCHPHIAALAQTAFPDLQPIEIGASNWATA